MKSRTRLARRPIAALAVSAALAGGSCSRSGARDAGEPLGQTVRVGLTFTRIGQGQGIRFEGSAHFARYAAADVDSVHALLGLDDDSGIPLDTCRVIDSARELDKALAAGTPEVQLLDAGRIQARGPLDAIALEPRHYPELTPYVAGVVYANDDAFGLTLAPGATYEVTAEGGATIPPFSAQVPAPRAFPSLDVPAYRRGGELEVRWQEPPEANARPALLSVAWSGRGESREVRCRVRDDGAFTLSRDLLAEMPPVSQLASAEVAFTRSRTAPIALPGSPAGAASELRLGLREVVPLPVSAWPVAGSTLPPPNAPVGEGER